MKIAIIGTGRVAAALGKGWAARGHMVTFASRQPGSEKVVALVEAAGPNAAAARVAESTIAPPNSLTNSVVPGILTPKATFFQPGSIMAKAVTG